MTAARDPPWPPETAAQRAEARSERFGYACHRCANCCARKVIQVNPYEIARLARRLGITTSEFRDRHTDGGDGAHLARRPEDDTCVFLGPQGCAVHPDRPLVCRIYPLGRHVAADGTERWSHMAPHPLSLGVYSHAGTIGDYVEDQGAGSYMQAADEYAAWVRAAYAYLAQAAADEPETGREAADLLDMDGMIADHCRRTGRAEPLDIEDRKALHLDLLAAWLGEMQEVAT